FIRGMYRARPGHGREGRTALAEALKKNSSQIARACIRSASQGEPEAACTGSFACSVGQRPPSRLARESRGSVLTVDISLPDVEELQKLVQDGIEKGFLTYDEIVTGLDDV